MQNRYFALRHGQSEANVQGIILSDPARGVPGYGLTEAGRAQVEASIKAAAKRGDLDGATVIYSSDFARALQTAELARRLLDADPVRVTQRLRERSFGELEGTSNAGYAQVWERDLENPGHTEWNVESAMSVLGRTSALVAELESSLRGATVVFVSHGDPLQIMETGFRTLNPAEHRSLPALQPGELRALVPGS